MKGLDARKDQELVSFLLIRADQHHSREALAALLWGDNPTAASEEVPAPIRMAFTNAVRLSPA